MDDSTLLAEYVRTGSQQHFATPVNRHVNWVYTICRRQAGDNLAEDVTQAVFATLARKAPHLRSGTSVSGWLFKTARYASATAHKIERRRREHERRAAAMNPIQTPPPTDQDWEQILFELDGAVARLRESDRCVILLRFYQGLSHEEAGMVLGISSVAAQRRVSRAVEKLRARLRHLPLVILPGTFEQALQNRLVTTAPPHIVSVCVSAAGTGPSAQATVIMKGAIIMKYFYALKLVGLFACLLTITGTGVWLILPVHAEFSPVATTQTAAVANPASVEFHIIADSATADPAELKAAQARLLVGGRGPSPLPGDSIRWVEVEYPEQFDRPGAPPETREWNGRYFIPVLVTPDASMDQSPTSGWNFVGARSFTQNGRSVAFSFDARGAKLFGDLTTHWYKLVSQRKDRSNPHARLAIIFGEKIISAPNINSPITGGSGVIERGGRGGFSQEEMTRLINAMNAGAMPPTTEPSSSTNPGN
jgi:RNA polymerase sigma factor (sigma-70 family)